MNDMVTEEYMKATKPAVDFLMDKHPFTATIAQAKGDTDSLIEMLEDIVKEAQQHIITLKSLEK